jgi:hypothetical protein
MDEATRSSHHRFATGLFNRVWELLEKTPRSADEDVAMLNAAHASLYHWLNIGDAKNFAIGEWQIARVYAVLKRAEPALHHAQRSLELSVGAKLPPFYTGYAHEALARAHALQGHAAAVEAHLSQARKLADAVDSADERRMLMQDLDTIQA